MEITDIMTTSAPLLVASVLTMVGRIVKISAVPDKYIPLILFVLGGFVYCALAGWDAKTFIFGLSIGGAAVGLNQGYRQLTTGTGASSDNDSNVSGGGSIITPLAAVLAGSLMLTGCATTQNGTVPSQTQVQATAAAVEAASQIGVFFAVRSEPNTKGYFELASSVIGILMVDGTYDPAILRKNLEDMTINELKEPEAVVAISSAISVYEVYFAEAVSKNLDKNVYVKPVMNGLKRGIELGVKLAETYKDTPPVEQ